MEKGKAIPIVVGWFSLSSVPLDNGTVIKDNM